MMKKLRFPTLAETDVEFEIYDDFTVLVRVGDRDGEGISYAMKREEVQDLYLQLGLKHNAQT